jgi:hypothetical protein
MPESSTAALAKVKKNAYLSLAQAPSGVHPPIRSDSTPSSTATRSPHSDRPVAALKVWGIDRANVAEMRPRHGRWDSVLHFRESLNRKISG